MHISIWQQWASNHSANFVLVGTFSTPEAATKVADELHSVLKQIQDYWQHIRLGDPEAQFEGILTPPEEVIKRRYNVEWIPVDWFQFSWYRLVDDHVKAVDRFVLFSNPVADTRAGPKPVTGLIERLGGEVAVFCEQSTTDPDSSLFGYVTFVAPNEAVAAKIHQILHQYCALGSPEIVASTDSRRFSEQAASEIRYRWRSICSVRWVAVGYEAIEFDGRYSDRDRCEGRYFMAGTSTMYQHQRFILKRTEPLRGQPHAHLDLAAVGKQPQWWLYAGWCI
jgi:hypothetical protein